MCQKKKDMQQLQESVNTLSKNLESDAAKFNFGFEILLAIILGLLIISRSSTEVTAILRTGVFIGNSAFQLNNDFVIIVLLIAIMAGFGFFCFLFITKIHLANLNNAKDYEIDEELFKHRSNEESSEEIDDDSL